MLADGRLAPLAQLGQHLAPDDPLVLAAAAAAERRWREAHPKVGALTDRSFVLPLLLGVLRCALQPPTHLLWGPMIAAKLGV